MPGNNPKILNRIISNTSVALAQNYWEKLDSVLSTCITVAIKIVKIQNVIYTK